MRPEDVSEEWLFTAYRAWRRNTGNSEAAIAAALAAVAPAIAAQEREECVKVAEAFPASTHGALATNPNAAAAQAADEIAAAIRARGTTP